MKNIIENVICALYSSKSACPLRWPVHRDSDERSEGAERALLASYPGPKYTPCASNGVAPQALREHEAAQRPNQRFTSSSELCSRVTLGPKYTPCASNRARSSEIRYCCKAIVGHRLVIITITTIFINTICKFI